VRQAQALRFEVFNIELEEGLQQSFETGLDVDQFDAVCDHLLVEHLPSRQVVGTYRLQSGTNAAAHYGFYCEQEFEFSRFEWAREEIIELGRACVQREHRNLVVLGLLWKGIADYARLHGGRYLLGCSSLTSQDPRVGASAYNEMYRRHLAPAEWRTRPLEDYDCPLKQLSADAPKLPKLLRAYLGIGAKICGAPALDRNFKTIDFLTLLDLQTLPAPVRSRFLDSSAQP
jgi:putative hemolysin